MKGQVTDANEQVKDFANEVTTMRHKNIPNSPPDSHAKVNEGLFDTSMDSFQRYVETDSELKHLRDVTERDKSAFERSKDKITETVSKIKEKVLEVVGKNTDKEEEDAKNKEHDQLHGESLGLMGKQSIETLQHQTKNPHSDTITETLKNIVK